MNSFQALKKPEKPVEIWSPPLSPQGQDLFLTPKFFTEAGQKDLIIERLTNENLELHGKVVELSNSLRLAEINYSLKIGSLEEIGKAKTGSIQEKYTEVEFESKIYPLTRSCKERIEGIFSILQESCEINRSVLGELMGSGKENENEEGDDIGINMSVVQEEGGAFELAGTQAQLIDDPLTRYNREPCEDLRDGEKLQSVRNVIKNKDREIRKHKDFIKMLKENLENILREHSKSKIENEKNVKEIESLKARLALKKN